MTREEIEKLSLVEPYCFENDREEMWYKIGCIDGLNAADAKPNATKLWHSPNETPKGRKWKILYDNAYDAQLVADWRCGYNWRKFVKSQAITRWAYIKDLLPKGGKE